MAQARVMFLGDSLVAGDEGNTVGHRSFRGRLLQLLAQGNYDVSVVGSQTLAPAIGGDPDHEGYVGSTIAAMRARIATILAGPVTVEIIVVLIGWADVIANTASIGTAYTGMIDDITTAKSSAKVVMCTLPPYFGKTEGETGATYPAYATLNTAIRGKTGSNIVLCDLASLSGTGNERSKYINDLIYESTHPSDSLRAGADGNQVYSDPWGGARYLDWQSVVDAVSAWQDPPPGGLPSWAGSSFAPRAAGPGHPYFMNNASALYPWVHGWLAAGHTAVNTGVEYRNLTAGVVTTSSQWIELFAGARIAGYFWNYDQIVSFGAVPPGCTFRQQPDGITTFWRAVGMYSPEGWPIDRVPSAGPALQTPGPIKGVNRAAIASAAGFYCVCQARLALDDPNGPDDRSQARYMVRVGADLYAARPDGTFWHDVNNTGGGRYDYVGYPRQTADFGGGRNRVLASTEWTTIGFLTMRPQGFNPGLAPPWASGWPENPYGKEPYGLTEAQVRANPPPLPSFWTATTAAAGLATSDYSPAQSYLMSQSGADRLAQAIYDRMVASTILAPYVFDSSGGTTPVLAAGASRSPRYNYQKVQPGDTLYSYEEAEVAAAQPPTWNQAAELVVVIGGSASGTVTATGSPTYSKVSGPPWFTINSSTGALGGTATDTSPTIYNAVLRATNAAGTADLEILIRVVEGVAITTTTLPGGTAGSAYLASLSVAGTGPFTWSIDSTSSAALAALGLALGGGSVFGAAPIAGTATFTVRATDPAGNYDEATLTIVISSVASKSVITTTSMPNGTVGVPYSAEIVPTGAPPFRYSIIGGALAAGLALSHVVDYDIALTGAAMKAAIGDPTAFGWGKQNFARGSEALVPGQNGWTLGPNLVYNGQIGTLDGAPAHQFTSNSAGNSYLNQAVSGFSVGDIVTVSFLCDTDQGTCWTTQNGIQYGVLDKTLVATGVWRWRMLVLVTAGSTMVVHAGRIDAPAANVWKATRVLVNRGINVGTYVKTTNAAIGTSHTPGWTVPGTAQARLPASTRASVAWEVTRDEVIGPPLLLGQTAIAGSPTDSGGTWTLGANNGVRWFFDASVPIHGAATYRVTFTVVSVTGGVVPDWNDAAGAAITAPGTYVREYNSYAYGPTTRFFDLQTGAGQAAVVRVDSIQLVVARAGELVPAAHNLFVDSWRLSTANGWDVGPNLTANGLDGTLNGWPAWKFTSVAVGNSYVGKSFAVSAGVLYSVRFYTDVNLGGGWISMGTTNRQITYARRLIATGVYEWTASFIPAATETTAYFLIGCVDTSASTVWRVSAPQWNYGAAPCAHVPTLGSAAFGSAIDWKLGNALARRATPGTGAVAGVPGTPPNYWLLISVAGIQYSIVGTGVVDGMQYTDIRWQGTATANGGLNVYFDTSPTGTPAQPGEQVSVSVFAQRVGGSSANINDTGIVLDLYDGAEAYGGNLFVSTGSPTDGALATNRTSAAFTIPSGSTWVRNVWAYFHQAVSIGDVVDITIRFSTPMLSRGVILLPAADALGWYQLRAENARTNNIRNSAMLGANTSLPTHWATDNGGTGTTFTVVGRSRLHGLPAVDIRVQGTPSTTNYNAIYFETFTQIAASTGQTRTTSALVARIGGTNAGVSAFGCGMNENTSGGVYVVGDRRADSLTPETRLHYYTRNLVGGGTVACVTPYLIWTVAAGVPIDFTIRIACPQEELGSFPSSRILSHGAAETRAIDSNAIPDTSPGFVSPTGGTLVAQYDRGDLVPAGVYPGVAEVIWDNDNRALIAAQPGAISTTNYQVRNANVTNVSNAHFGYSGLNKVAATWASARADSSQNGQGSAFDTSVVLPATTSAADIRVGIVNDALDGGIRALYYRGYSIPGPSNAVNLSLEGGGSPSMGDRALVSGTPTLPGGFQFRVSAENDFGVDDKFLAINIVAAGGGVAKRSPWDGALRRR